jgi:hypothetical protein
MVTTIRNIRKKYEKSSTGILMIRIFKIWAVLYSTTGRVVRIPLTAKKGMTETK